MIIIVDLDYLAQAERGEVEAVYSWCRKPYNRHLQKTDFFFCNTFSIQSSCNFVWSYLLPLHTFLTWSTRLWDGSLKAIKSKFMSVSFVLGKEVHSAHCTSTSTLTTRGDWSPNQNKQKNPGKGTNPESVSHNFPGIPGKRFTGKKHYSLGLHLFERFSQLKLEKMRLASSLISIIRRNAAC